MPPATLTIPIIQSLLGNPTMTQYTTIKETFYRFIVSIGFYHPWYYDYPDRGLLWAIIFRIVHAIIPLIVPDPAMAVISRPTLLGVY